MFQRMDGVKYFLLLCFTLSMSKNFILSISSTNYIPHCCLWPIFAVFWHKFDINCNFYACLPYLCLKGLFCRFQAQFIHHMTVFCLFFAVFWHKFDIDYHQGLKIEAIWQCFWHTASAHSASLPTERTCRNGSPAFESIKDLGWKMLS